MKKVLDYKKPAFWAVIMAAAVFVAAALFFLTNLNKTEDTGVYACGKLLGQLGALSYIPEDGRYYDGIFLSKDMLRVINFEGEVLYESGEYAVSRYTYDELLSRLEEDFMFWKEDDVLSGYEGYESIEVYSYFEDGFSDVAFSIYRFDGKPLWFAEGEFLRIYKMVYMGEQYRSAAPLYRLPGDYSLEDAKEDGCVVFENGDLTSGEAVWNSFLKMTGSGKPVRIRLAYYYAIEDPSRYEPEHYEEIKDEYPALYIKDLIYDGEGYTVEGYEDGKRILRRYSHLMKYEGKPRSKWASFSEYVRYVLTNDKTVTWEDIEDGMFSSMMGDWIDHYLIYSIYK